jgi:tetratricopeptide (TPR) repeat protein
VFRRIIFGLLAALPLTAASIEDCADALDRWEFLKAAGEAEELVGLNPGSAPARILLARARIGLNQSGPALNELHEALRLDPKNQEALYYLVKLSSVLSQQQFLELARLAPDSPRAHQIRGEGLAARGDSEGAEREYLAALSKRPNAESVIIALGDLKRFDGHYEAALEWYQKALKIEAGNYDALYGSGACHLLLREPEEALPFFRRALTADPKSLAVKLALGQTLLDVKRAGEAVSLLEEAAGADPNLKRLQYLLSRAYKLIGRPEDATRALKRFRELSETDRDAELLPIEEKQ